VPGNHHEAGAGIAVGDGNAGVIGDGDSRGNAGNDFKGDAGFDQFLGFFTTSAKNVRVTAFESDDGSAFAGLLDEELIQFILGDGVLIGAFAGVQDFGGAGCVSEKVGVD
jgi:hypothetical protein